MECRGPCRWFWERSATWFGWVCLKTNLRGNSRPIWETWYSWVSCVSQERRAQGETHSWLCVCVFFAAVFLGLQEGLELSSNNFRGPLPLSLEGLVKLRVLDVADNFLTGTVDGLRSLPSLVELSLQRNSFQGSISFAFCQSVLHIASDCNSRMVCNCCTDCVVGGF